MWIRKIRLKNAGPFEDFSVDLTRGAVGIFGPNGSGKSTLLNAMYALVTNDFGRFPMVKDKFIRATADDKAPAFVSGEIEHNGRVIAVTRRLKGSRQTEVAIDGGEPITDANKAKVAIAEVLGVDNGLIDQYVFKGQSQIYDFIDSTPAVRARAYQIMCRTKGCEEAWNVLGEFLNQDRDITAQVVDNSDELVGAIDGLKAEAEELENRAKTEEEKLLNTKSRQSAETILRNAQRYADLAGDLAKTQYRVNELTERLRDGTRITAERESVSDAARREADALKPAAQAARAALKVLAQYEVQRKRKVVLENERSALVAEVKKNQLPEPPENVDSVDDLREQLANRRTELAQARSVLDNFGSGKKTRCPTCGTPVDAMHAHIKEMEKVVARNPALIALLAAEVAAVEDYRVHFRSYEKWLAGFDARRKANSEARLALADLKTAEGDEADLNAAVEAEAIAWERYETEQRSYVVARDMRVKMEAELTAANTRFSEIRQEMTEVAEDVDRINKARTRLAEDTTARTLAARTRGELAGVAARLADREEELKKLRFRLKRSERIRELVRVADLARETLHYSRLPRRVAQINLLAMEGDINRGLASFGDPYWVEADDELSFVVHRPGIPPHPADWLSTGQRVVLAVAFWPAVASLWGSDLGMLCLDEPTANLDEDNRKFLADAVATLSAEVRGRRQLVMVTHDPNLRGAFDQVIDLG